MKASKGTCVRIALAMGMLVLPCVGFSQASGTVSAAVQDAALASGSASVQLPDGTRLQTGGKDRLQRHAAVVDSEGRSLVLPSQLIRGRSGHSATVLADGKVLLLGGVGVNAAPVLEAEAFDPTARQFQAIAATGLLPRAYHTATLLTDARVLIVGGVDGRGAPILDAELWNPATGRVERISARLRSPRSQHQATLLPSGEVMVWGGVGSGGSTLSGAEVFNPATQDFSAVATARAQDTVQTLLGAQAPAVHTSLPAAEAREVPGNRPLVVRFNKRLEVSSLNAQSITLIGPNGSEPVKVVPAEQGLLLFVWPTKDLLPGSRHTLFLNGAADASLRRVPLTAIGFDTEALGSAAPPSPTTAVVTSGTALVATPPAKPLIDAQTLAAMEADDEMFVPGEEHRKGTWLSGKAGQALIAKPRSALLREKLYGRQERQHRLLEQRAQEQGLSYDGGAETQRGRRVAWQGFKDKDALHTALSSNDPSELKRAVGSEERTARLSWADVRDEYQAESALRNEAAETGPTALTGQVLRFNGKPLANVTLSVGGVSVRTDAQGEFTISGIPSGSQVLTIDGTSANRANARYGVFQYRTDVPAGRATALPFVIWMPKLDMRHAVKIDSPLTKETVITHPLMPGLEVVLSPGTVIRDARGKVVTEVSLTPIPVDQTPFPMPYFGVQLHYTLQPGGATLEGVNGKPQPATVRYPNYTGYGPGTPMSLFDYDPHGRGWYVYAQAQVSATDPTRLSSASPFLIYQFNATSASSGGPPGEDGDPCTGGSEPGKGGSSGWGQDGDSGGQNVCSADPVDLSRGQFTHMERDLMVPDIVPIDFIRIHKSPLFKAPPSVRMASSATGDTRARVIVRPPPPFGAGTSHPYEVYLYMPTPDYGEINVVLGNGLGARFLNRNGAVCCFTTQTFQSAPDSTNEFRGAYIRYDQSRDELVLYFRDGRKWGFNQYSAKLRWMADANDNRLSVVRQGTNTMASRIVSPSGRWVNIAYNSNGQVSGLEDSLGRRFTYTYAPTPTSGIQLTEVTDPLGHKRLYGEGGLTSVTDPNGHVRFTNEYGANGRISRQTLADGSFFTFDYTVDATTLMVQRVDVTDRRGSVRRAEFNGTGDLVRNTLGLGTPEEQVTTYEWSNRHLMARTDALGRRTTYAYDPQGNMTRYTRLDGTANAVTTSATYDAASNRPATITDPLTRVTRLAYDARGNLLTATDPLTNVTRVGYDPQGKVASVTSPLLKKTQFSYDGPDLASVTDPLSRKVQYLTDAVGRVMTTIDPLGNRTYNEWDALNRLTKVTNPMGGQVKFNYDKNGNVTEQIDEREGKTVNAYNSLGKIERITDPLNAFETRTYQAGKIQRQIDRKGQLSEVTYDPLGRVKRIGFGATAAVPTAYRSVVELTWDKGNRLTKLVEKTCTNPTTSLNCATVGSTNTTTRGYDDLNRLQQEITPQAQVNYTYDAANRRRTMIVRNGAPGAQTVQPTITYTWDDGDRLSQISQAAGTVNGNVAQVIDLRYDKAGRRTGVTLANKSTIAYGYDDADQTTSITYRKADNTLIGDLTYTYDPAGRRITADGSLARLNLPAADISDAAYDAANRLTRWGGKTFSYDTNGSLIGDGVQSYQWDERNRLKGITTGATAMASFQYDSEGRRRGKTVGGTTTGFVYDGDNFVQELLGTSNTAGVKAQLLTGGIDETFLRMQGTELSSVLSDANNNTVRLLDKNQVTAVDYTYEPYGTTAVTAANGNSQQYTGRENDNPGNSHGLYFYRARYYMPGCARFISEDPIGWASGQTNIFGYVGGDPISFSDPFGLARPNTALYDLLGHWDNFNFGRELACSKRTADMWTNWARQAPSSNADWRPSDYYIQQHYKSRATEAYREAFNRAGAEMSEKAQGGIAEALATGGPAAAATAVGTLGGAVGAGMLAGCP